ncbi:MAG: DUF3467 domain-containing protein [Acidobacteria bacterium]|nr:DUF3467 domain-containing protein [Acidobacteriota bacterium]MCG3191805.1 hypothetical protein [Thermoanaerobaculia bacterium]MCK6685390.1 DUF3467 domain-containing protein [Thermoanaerobaculia bacterium]
MSESPKKPEGTPPQLQISIDEQVALGHYFNFANIIHNGAEFVIDFGRIVPGRSDVRILTRILTTPLHAKQLLNALAHNISMYEKTFGTIRTEFDSAGEKTVVPNEPN